MAKSAIPAHEPVVTGWFSHANQFGFEERYRPTGSIEKCLVGTPPILSLRAVLHGVRCFDGVNMNDVAGKSGGLSRLLIRLADERLAENGLALASPREPAQRGSQVSFRHAHAYALSKALRAAGVVVDFRSPDILRFGITPLYHALCRCVGCGGRARAYHGERELEGASERRAGPGHVNSSARQGGGRGQWAITDAISRGDRGPRWSSATAR